MANASPSTAATGRKAAHRARREAMTHRVYVGCPDGSPHRWRIAEVVSAYSPAACVNCGMTREYYNLEPEWGSQWEGKITALPQ